MNKIGVVLGGLFLSCSTLQAQSGDEFEWTGAVAVGKSIEIKGVNGEVKAGPASGNQTRVSALKSGRRSDPDEVTIEVVEHSGGVTICAVYPSKNPARPNECVPGEGGRMNVNNNDVQVEFEVEVPAGVHFIGRNVNGQIEVESLAGDVQAHTVNGEIKISTSGAARAKTVNGSIDASLGSLDSNESLSFETVNGSIEVTVPAGINAHLRAETVNGDFSSDFPVTIQGRFGPKRIDGVIGSGGPELRLKTVNGSIDLFIED